MDIGDPTLPASADFERDMLPLLKAMDPDARLACEKMILWIADRPKDAEQLTQAEMEQMVKDVRLENIRRRLGGTVGQILPFKKPG